MLLDVDNSLFNAVVVELNNVGLFSNSCDAEGLNVLVDNDKCLDNAGVALS